MPGGAHTGPRSGDETHMNLVKKVVILEREIFLRNHNYFSFMSQQVRLKYVTDIILGCFGGDAPHPSMCTQTAHQALEKHSHF